MSYRQLVVNYLTKKLTRWFGHHLYPRGLDYLRKSIQLEKINFLVKFEGFLSILNFLTNWEKKWKLILGEIPKWFSDFFVLDKFFEAKIILLFLGTIVIEFSNIFIREFRRKLNSGLQKTNFFINKFLMK